MPSYVEKVLTPVVRKQASLIEKSASVVLNVASVMNVASVLDTITSATNKPAPIFLVS